MNLTGIADIQPLIDLGLSYEDYQEIARNTEEVRKRNPKTRLRLIKKAQRTLGQDTCCKINRLVNYIFGDRGFFENTSTYNYSSPVTTQIITSAVVLYLLRERENKN